MGKIRIIGGVHRSRKLIVLDEDGLRPTLDRIKETLFNWLAQDLTGKTCLDLFAGSGSLGFEAVSRNAYQVVMVEQNGKVVEQLKKNIQLLKTQACHVYHTDAVRFIAKSYDEFDVIFLDPPYQSELLDLVLPDAMKLLKPGGVCYIEYLKEPDVNHYQILKKGKAGKINYLLLANKSEE